MLYRASVLSCAETVSDGAASLLFPGERENCATARCDDVGQTAEDTVTVLDDLATAAMQEIELMWSCLGEENQRGQSKSSEDTAYDGKKKGKKKEVTPIIFSFSSDVSVEGVTKDGDGPRRDTVLPGKVELGTKKTDDESQRSVDK